MKLKKIFGIDAIYGMNCRLGRPSFFSLNDLVTNRTILDSPDESFQFFVFYF